VARMSRGFAAAARCPKVSLTAIIGDRP
jgi:hypothetical protein